MLQDQPSGELAIKLRGRQAALILVLGRWPPTSLLDTQSWYTHTQPEGSGFESLPLAPLALRTMHILQLYPELHWHVMGWAWAAGPELQRELGDQEMDRF